jgi:hypothetical protein
MTTPTFISWKAYHDAEEAERAAKKRARMLKDLYPCAGCKTPIPVASRRMIGHAHCERCSRRIQLLTSAALCIESSDKSWKAVNDVVEEATPLVLGWIEAMALRLTAAKRLLEAQPFCDPREQRNVVAHAQRHVEWVQQAAAGVLEQFPEALAEAAPHLEELDGAGENSETPKPSLRLVRAEEKP